MTNSLSLKLILLLLMQALTAWSNPVDVQRARRYAVSSGLLPEVTKQLATMSAKGQQRVHHNRLLKLAYTLPNANDSLPPLLYAFVPPSGKGYVIIAGDDAVEPVLGYSTSAPFDTATMPAQFEAFLHLLGQYVAQAAAQTPQTAAPLPAKTDKAPISPLLGSIRWGQNAPFNTLTPMDGQRQSVTGCVATALSQILYYHRHPARAEGQASYGFTNFFKHGRLVTLGAQGDYQWDKMRPDYLSAETLTYEEQHAVGLLMYEVGVACNMAYGAEVSSSFGVNALKALHKHLDYPAAHIVRRMHMSADEWDNLIYGELAANRPVYMDAAAAEMGHAFVCDGYDSRGYYHINWGWNGTANGYFKITDLAPTLRGTGGLGRGGYVVDLQAIVHIAPPAAGLTPQPFGLQAKGLTKGKSYANDYPKFNIKGVRLEGYETIEVDFSLGVRTATGELLNVGQSSGYEIRKLFTYNNIEVLLYPDRLPEGSHRLVPIYSPRGQNDWQEIALGRYFNGTIHVNKQGGVFSAVEQTDSIRLEVGINKTFLLSGTNNELHFRITNTGQSAYSSYVSVLLSQDEQTIGQTVNEALVKDNMTAIHLEPGESRDVIVPYRSAVSTATYRAYVTFDPTNGLSEKENIVPTTILSQHLLTVKDKTLYGGTLSVAFDSLVYTVHRNDPLHALAKITASADGIYQGATATLQCFICLPDGGGVVQRYPAFDILLDKGTSQDYAPSGTVLLKEGDYELLVNQITKVGNLPHYDIRAKATLRVTAPRQDEVPPSGNNPSTDLGSVPTSASDLKVRLHQNLLSIEGLTKPATIELLTTAGVSLMKATVQPDTPVRLNNLPQGIYLIKVNGKGHKALVP